MNLKRILIFILLLLFECTFLFAFPSLDLLKSVSDENGIEDYEPFDDEVKESDIENAEATSSGWTSAGRGGIVSAVGFFNYGDTVDVFSKDGSFVGRYNVFDTAVYESGERKTLYKLLKPIYKSYYAPHYIPKGYMVKKNFLTTLTPLYSALFSNTYGMVHEASIYLSFPKFFYPIPLIAGPIYLYMENTKDNILGGFLGASYDLPLDYMFMITTNLHFVFDFRLILATSLSGLYSFYYGYSLDAGLKWYAFSLLSIRASFVLTSLYETVFYNTVFKNMGIQVGVSFEF